MFELKSNQCASEYPVDETTDAVKKTNTFASINKIPEENSEFRSTYKSVMSVHGDEVTNEEYIEVECVDNDGHDYILT